MSSSPPPPSSSPMTFTESPNARSKSITTAELDTHGVLNRHATKNTSYQVGVSEDKGARRTMEDAYSFVVDFGGVRGQGFFAVFDGHAGKHAAEWCGSHFHEYLLSALSTTQDLPVPDILNQTFHNVDESLSRICEESAGKIHSWIPLSSSNESLDPPSGDEAAPTKKKARKSLTGALQTAPDLAPQSPKTPRSQSPTARTIVIPPTTSRRVLYSANAGDARGVLCRGGKAIRLTYDHKGSDKQEAKRITDAGGFVMSGRVNGVLAVTRSLGDSSMKEFVVGAPSATEDEFLVLACDGLWDVASDQSAIDLIRDIADAQVASEKLLKHALNNHTSDNVTVLVIRFKK
ncbi:phosphatase 2C-like domain-containing protein [Mycena rebaudengoi]|nr:phosphatase 2C-like domain-containing protein [Mycena rebaudengoi]